MIEFKMFPILVFYTVPFTFALGVTILIARFGWEGLIPLVILIVGIFVTMLLSAFYGKFAMKRSGHND